eukprot:TRINITY_DN526_c1_g1_i6.p1 TRINITY_DN526_c1_g1~~TRINITY_DN526_c1_g1_i6.p1  ORF type:complete len:154 (+),score=10.09 TRINITY_DN526_c1_g1_i6:771-1232(+)
MAGAVDTEALCVIAGQVVWSVRCDIKVLDNHGNVIDAANLAAAIALRHFKRPEIDIDEGRVTMVRILSLSLTLSHSLTLSLSLFSLVYTLSYSLSLSLFSLVYTLSYSLSPSSLSHDSVLCGIATPFLYWCIIPHCQSLLHSLVPTQGRANVK